MKVGLDTNILAYAEGMNDATKTRRTNLLLADLPAAKIVIPLQVMGELYNVLARKARRAPHDIIRSLTGWSRFATIAPTTPAAFADAMDAAANHGLQIWDAVILAVAREHGCHLVLSEDMQHGFIWTSVTVVNPFTDTPHPLLKAAIPTS